MFIRTSHFWVITILSGLLQKGPLVKSSFKMCLSSCRESGFEAWAVRSLGKDLNHQTASGICDLDFWAGFFPLSLSKYY